MKLSFRCKLFFIIIIIFSLKAANAGTAFADTTITINNIFSDTTLDPSITYAVYGLNNTVWTGATLTIPAGTHIVFAPGSALTIGGALKINGTMDNHVIVTGGTPPPSIPFITVVYAPSQSPETASPEVAPLTVSNSAMMTTIDPSQEHFGFIFGPDSVSTISYLDISEANYAFRPTPQSKVTADHILFKHDDIGIMSNVGAYLKMTDSTFDTVNKPAVWDFRATFIHSNTTFINTGIQGWTYDSDLLAGDNMKLDSTDGDYYLPNIVIGNNTTLTISPGVRLFIKDGGSIQINGGTLSALGTADKPITFYGDGACTSHSPVMSFQAPEKVSLQYANFSNLCNGLYGTRTTVVFSHLDFNTIAGTAMAFDIFSTVTADYITMMDIYQGFKISYGTRFSTTNDIIGLANTTGAAIDISGQSPSVINNTHIDGAATCIAVSQNSSLTADKLTLSDCTKTGIFSINDDATAPSALSLTNSEIGYSGGAMNLTYAVIKNVSNNNFHNDSKGVVLNHMPKTILANNFWGDSTGPHIDTNPGGKGTILAASDVSELIYRPWIGMEPAPEHNPIIIIPGITGSVLTKNYDDKSELWPNIAKLALSPSDSFLNDLELLQSGKPSSVRPVVVGDIIRSTGQVDVFDGLIGSLLQNGYKEGTDLFVLPYDWRLSNTQNQALLKDSIVHALSASGKSKVNIIAHSMGGLLAKDYLAENPDAPIDHLFFIATPHLGTPKVFKALMYGDDMGYNFSIASALSIHVLNPDRVKIIAQNMPAVYELLPSQSYINKFGPYLKDLAVQTPLSNVNEIESYMVGQGRNNKMFSFAQTLHTNTDALDTTTIPTYNFVGCGATKTIGNVLFGKEISLGASGPQITDETRLRYVQGDGAVPRASAESMTGAVDYYVSKGSHGSLPSVPEIQHAINAILNGTPVATSSSITTSSSDCAVTGEVVEVHSPVVLDIYDDQGRHTGPTASGDTEFGIPNVDYEIIGNDKFAFLPTGPTYKVMTHAQADGSYDMYISHSDNNDAITQETYFNQVPITDGSAGTVIIGPGNDSYSINLDKDGDGIADMTVSPTSVLNTTAATDDIPPITTASIVASTVTLTATDDNSGVLSTKYSTDAIHWVDYSNPFTIAADATVYFFSQDKAGNVENVKQITASTASETSTPTDTPNPANQKTDDVPPSSTTVITNNTTNNITNNPAPINYNPVPIHSDTTSQDQIDDMQSSDLADTTQSTPDIADNFPALQTPTTDKLAISDQNISDHANPATIDSLPAQQDAVVSPISLPESKKISPASLLASVAGIIPRNSHTAWLAIALIILFIIIILINRQ
jgi:pimeloyl-ACP methyl ester carboxylesterase